MLLLKDSDLFAMYIDLAAYRLEDEPHRRLIAHPALLARQYQTIHKLIHRCGLCLMIGDIDIGEDNIVACIYLLTQPACILCLADHAIQNRTQYILDRLLTTLKLE